MIVEAVALEVASVMLPAMNRLVLATSIARRSSRPE